MKDEKTIHKTGAEPEIMGVTLKKIQICKILKNEQKQALLFIFKYTQRRNIFFQNLYFTDFGIFKICKYRQICTRCHPCEILDSDEIKEKRNL